MNSVLPFTSNSHRRRHFSSPSLFNAPNTPLPGLTFTASCSQLQLQKDQGRRRGSLCGRHGACWGSWWSPCPIREELRLPGHHSSSAPPGCWDLAVPSHPARPCEMPLTRSGAGGAGGARRARGLCPTQSCLCPLLFFPAPLSAQPHPSHRAETQLPSQGGGGAAAEMSISLGDGDGAIGALMASPGL